MELVESKISAKEYKKQINTILVLTSNIGTLSKLYKDGIFLESTKTLIKCILDKTLPDSKQTSDSEMHSEITCTNEQYVISHYVDALSKIISTITDTITLSKLQSQSQLGYIQCLYQTKLEMIEFSDAKHKIKRCDFHYEEQIRKIVHNITNKKVLNMLNCDSNKFYPITYKIIVERLAELSLATEPQFQKPSTNCCYEAPTAYPESAFDDILGDKHTSSDMPPESLE